MNAGYLTGISVQQHQMKWPYSKICCWDFRSGRTGIQ